MATSLPQLPVGATELLPITFGDVNTRLTANAKVDVQHDVERTDQPAVRTNVTSFDIPALVVVDGQPVADSGYGAILGSKAGVATFTQVVQPLNPHRIELDSYARWLPNQSYLTTQGPLRYWWPRGWPENDPNSPRMALKRFTGVGTGQDTFGKGAPYVDLNYSYQGFVSRMQRAAMVFDGEGFAGTDMGGADNYSNFTLAMVAVFRPTLLPQYGLYESERTPGTQPLEIRYTHGRLDVHHNGRRLITHQTIKPAQYPAIILLAFHGSQNTIRIYCLDKSRSTKEIAVPTLNSISLRGAFGALGQGTEIHPIRDPSEMDLLEYNVWTRALSWPEMESTANLLSLAYGVAG